MTLIKLFLTGIFSGISGFLKNSALDPEKGRRIAGQEG
jgi:hypothetical protein